MPQVSVIIATRNRCELLPRAIESARVAGSNTEIIVVDDASEDRTSDVCKKICDLRYLRTRTQLGLGGARNVGILASTSEYISFLDDDDVRLPGSLDAQLAALEARPDAGMVYGQAEYGDKDCQPKGGSYPEQCPEGDVFWRLLHSNFVPCPTVVFRRACLLCVGLLEEQAPGIEDWDLWLRIAELYPVLVTPQPVAVWRQPSPTSHQLTSRPDHLHKLLERLHRDKWMRLPRVLSADKKIRRELRRAFADRMTQQLIWAGAVSVRAKDLRGLMRIASVMGRFHPLAATRKTFRASTWGSLVRSNDAPRSI